MSFWVVPASAAARSAPCSSATTWYSASSHIAVALIVIEVFIVASGMPSNSARMSPRCATGTPTLPTSPRASAGPGRSRSGWAGRTRPRGPSGPSRGCAGRARWRPRRWSARRTCASPTAGRAPAAAGSCSARPWAEGSRGRLRWGGPQAVRADTPDQRARRGTVVPGQHPVQAGDAQQPVQARGDVHEDEAAPRPTGTVVGADEDAEPGGVVHLGAGQVHHQVARPAVQHACSSSRTSATVCTSSRPVTTTSAPATVSSTSPAAPAPSPLPTSRAPLRPPRLTRVCLYSRPCGPAGAQTTRNDPDTTGRLRRTARRPARG